MGIRWVCALVIAFLSAGAAHAGAPIYGEDFENPELKPGQSVKETPIAWTLVSPNDPAKSLVGDVSIATGKYGLTGNYIDGSTAAAQESENVFQSPFPALVLGQVVLKFKAYAEGESSAGSSVGLAGAQLRFSNRGGGWISTATGWTFWAGHVDSSTYPLGDQKFGPYQILQEQLDGAHDTVVELTMTVDLDRSKTWGEARWTDSKGRMQAFKSAMLDWDSAAGNVGSVIVTMDKRSGHTGIAVDELRVEGELPLPKPHPFGHPDHVVRQFVNEKQSILAPAKITWISQPWGGENAQMPYIVYMPEKDRLLMLVECGSPIHSALIESDDHGETWSARRWLSTDKDGNPNAGGLGLTYLGNGTLVVYPENLNTQWVSTDYGQSWAIRESTGPAGERYTWDPTLTLDDGKRMAQAWWKPTGVAWGSSEAPYSQAYIRFSDDAGLSWSDDIKVPQWLGVNEVSMMKAPNGNWIAACRTDNPKRFAHWGFDHYSGLGVSISKDEGKTWSDLNVLYEWGRHHPSMVLLPDGRIVMSYVVRLGYPNTLEGFEQFGVEAVVSSDNGQTWDLEHRYVLADWVGNVKGENAWYCGVQSSSTVLLPDGTLLTAFGTGFQNQPGGEPCKMNAALVKWRLND
ncbi:MAG: sialidase family protein [Candidatus Hydrogenedentales bacterium]|jgi:hypothetical protein